MCQGGIFLTSANQSAFDTIMDITADANLSCSAYENMEQRNADRRRKTRCEWKAEHPGWHRNWWLKKEYGISLVEFNRLVEEQKGLCAICEELPGKRGLHADHCHVNGGVRGLLCFRCNAALGLFRNNPRLLVNAIDYLVPRVVRQGRYSAVAT
jgi:hypothetical protein